MTFARLPSAKRSSTVYHPPNKVYYTYIYGMKKVTIDIVSDIICPWCYIGKARLERAIASVADSVEVTVKMRPFLLYPQIPKGGIPKDHFKSVKKPGLGSALRAEAKKENIVIDYSKIDRIPNTLEAHRLMYLCPADKKNELGKILFRKYFEEGQDVEDESVLTAAAKEAGLSAATITQFLETTDGATEIEAEIAELKEEGIRVVPSFILNGEHVVPGAQPMENFQRYFARLK